MITSPICIELSECCLWFTILKLLDLQSILRSQLLLFCTHALSSTIPSAFSDILLMCFIQHHSNSFQAHCGDEKPLSMYISFVLKVFVYLSHWITTYRWKEDVQLLILVMNLLWPLGLLANGRVVIIMTLWVLPLQHSQIHVWWLSDISLMCSLASSRSCECQGSIRC